MLDIKNICMQQLHAAESITQVIKDRETAIKYYNCEPYGDEKDGESKFVTSDVRDTIEWMLPQIVESFTAEEGVVDFCAKDANDVPAAKLETAYVNHVYSTQNNGFLNTYEWVKDGLLLKNGVIKSWWDEKVDEIEEEYEGKSFLEFQQIISDPQVEVKEVTVSFDDESKELSYDEAVALGLPLELATFELKVIRTEDNSQVRVKVIPPENFFVESGHNSLDLENCLFVCHRDTATESDLIIDGYSKKLVESIPDGKEEDLDPEKLARHHGDSIIAQSYENSSAREITIYECYIRIDQTGNGKSELRMVKLAGKDGAVLLENEVVDSIPFSCWTPVINCHKFYGMSYADLVGDIQRLRSVLWRQTLNSLYMSNHPAKTIIESQVYKEDLLQTGPGAIWRMKSPGAIETHVTPFVGQQTIPVLSMVEEMRQERTGVSPASQGLDPSALADSTNLVGPMIMSQALQRVKMVARIFAETGFKHLMLRIHGLCSKHDMTRTFPMGAEFQTVDPRQWTKRTQYKVKVGIGYIDKMQRVQAIQAIINNQTLIAQSGGQNGPLLEDKNIYEALVEQAKLLGYTDGAKFYRDPKTYQAPPQGQSEAIQITEATTVADLTKSKAANDIALKKHDDEMALKAEQMKMEHDLKIRQMEQDKELRREELVLQYGITRGSNVGFDGTP